MPRTPDDFPGIRIDEGISLITTGSYPDASGEIFYVSGSGTGQPGFYFNEEGVVRGLSNGLDEFTHENLNTLVHDPIIGVSDVTYNTIGVTSLTLWTDLTRTVKLQDHYVNYGFNMLISSVTSSVYVSGTLNKQVVEEPSYDMYRRITSIKRTRTV
jgi:hypothetical protein